MLELILAHFAGCFIYHSSSQKANKDIFFSKTEDSAPAHSKAVINNFTDMQIFKWMFIFYQVNHSNGTFLVHQVLTLNYNRQLQKQENDIWGIFLSEIVETHKV